MKRILVSALALLFASTACAPTSEEPASTDAPAAAAEVAVSTAHRALMGRMTIGGACGALPGPGWTDPPASDAAALRVKLRDAKAYAEQVVVTEAFRTCVEQSIYIDHFGWTPERIVTKSSTPDNITVECANLGATVQGRAHVDIPFELFKLDTRFVRNSPIEDIAGVMVHEILHTHGATHLSGGAISFSVPRAAQRCIALGRTEGLPRDEIAGDVALAPVGGMGGLGIVDPVTRHGRCDGDELGRGLELDFDGTRIRTASLLCADETNGTLWNERRVGGYAYGSSTSQPTTRHALRCPTGWAMTGLVGRQSDIDLRQVRVACTPIAALRADGPDTPTQTGLVGASVGYGFERHCPAGKVVMGIRQRGYDAVGELQIVCDDIASPDAPRERLVRAPGQPVWNQEVQWTTCEGEQYAMSFFGDRTNALSLERIGAGCITVMGDHVQPVSPARMNRASPAGASSTKNKRMFDFRCAPGELAVGYRVWHDHRARGAQPRCATPAEWRVSTAAHRPPVGTPVTYPGTRTEALCPLGQAVTGFRTVGEGSIKQLDLRCKDLPLRAPRARDLRPRLPGRPAPSTAVGGLGGVPFTLRCPEGGPLSGVPTYLDETGRLTGVGATCGGTDGHTMYANGYPRAPFGGTMVRREGLRCAAGMVIVGVRGETVGSRIGKLGPTCQSLRSLREGVVSWVSLHIYGNEAGTPFHRRCAPGQVVTGVVGRVGAAVDQIDVECSPLDLVRGSRESGLWSGDFRRLVVPDDVQGSLSITVSQSFGAAWEVLVKRGSMPTATDYDARVTTSFFGGTAALPGPVQSGIYWVTLRRISGSGTASVRVH